MRLSRLVSAVACTLVLVGCQGPSPKPQLSVGDPPILASKVFACSGECKDSQALRAISFAFDTCRNTQNLYERRGFNSKASQFAVAVAGALAGAVAAPIAKGSGTKAWSGLSGAANGIQNQLNEQFSDAIAAQDRQAVLDAMTRGEERLRVAPDANKKVLEAEIMAYDCTMAAASIDAAINHAINTAAKAAADNKASISQQTITEIKAHKGD